MVVGVIAQGVANIVRPDMPTTRSPRWVGFAVAVILFEVGLNLKYKVLLTQATAIRRLVMVGAVVTATAGTVVCRLVMGWSWTLSILFGTLVIVTGPTVITPLLRRIRVKHQLSIHHPRGRGHRHRRGRRDDRGGRDSRSRWRRPAARSAPARWRSSIASWAAPRSARSVG
jgi:hypothetical protein